MPKLTPLALCDETFSAYFFILSLPYSSCRHGGGRACGAGLKAKAPALILCLPLSSRDLHSAHPLR